MLQFEYIDIFFPTEDLVLNFTLAVMEAYLLPRCLLLYQTVLIIREVLGRKYWNLHYPGTCVNSI
jgi:hypothetical protein